MSVHRGLCGANLTNTARGAPGIRQLRDDSACAYKLKPSCTGLRGCCGPGVPRALVLRGRRRKARLEEGVPGAITKNTGDESRPEIGCLKIESVVQGRGGILSFPLPSWERVDRAKREPGEGAPRFAAKIPLTRLAHARAFARHPLPRGEREGRKRYAARPLLTWLCTKPAVEA